MKMWGLVIRVQEGGPRRNAFSAEQSRDPKVWSAIHGNIPRDSIDKDIHHEGIGQKGTMKYLRESCYHRIECSVTYSLAALIWKWYLNSNFQPYNYSLKLQKDTNGTRINVKNVVYTWRVDMKEGRPYKRERIPWGEGIRELREKHCKNKNRTCNQIQKRYIQEPISSDSVDDDFL